MFEMVEDRVRDEASSRGIHVPVPALPLLMDKEALRDDHVKVVFGPGHRDVQKTTLFLDLRRAPCG